MKLLVLVLSLLFVSSSVFGNNLVGVKEHPKVGTFKSNTISKIKVNSRNLFKNLFNATTSEAICGEYSIKSKYKKEEKVCFIPSYSFGGSKQVEEVCGTHLSLRPDEYNRRGCYIPELVLHDLRSLCLHEGRKCPKNIPNYKPEETCKNAREKKCSVQLNNKEDEKELISLLTNLVNAIHAMESDENTENICSSMNNMLSKRLDLVYSSSEKCEEEYAKCTIACDSETCKGIEEETKKLYAEEDNLALSMGVAEGCHSKTESEEGKQEIKEHARESIKGITHYDSTNDFKNQATVIIDGKSSTKGLRKIRPQSQVASKKPGEKDKDQPAQEGITLRKKSPHEQNEKYAKETFGKLKQEIADRMNKGKATVENRKPNTLNKVNNDHYANKQNKDNKYLVASSNDSFLTKKDIFQTVSNAYYKMCQTDSCYGIVKK